jgi:hypothetical protein
MKKTLYLGLRGFSAIAALLLVSSAAQANLYCSGSGNDHGHDHGFGSSDFSFFATPTAWDPGANTARLGGFPAAGGATWSVMGAGLGDVSGFPDSHGGALTTSLSGLYAGGVDEVTTIGLALDVWAAVSGFTNLGQVADGGGGFGAAGAAGGGGDIRVGAIFIDGAVGGNVLAHAYQPGTEAITLGGNILGDVHMDNSNSWSDGGGAGTIDYFTVMLHELGHSLGLDHSTVVGSVMEAVYAGPRRTLGDDDIGGIQAIYGAAPVGGPIPEPATVTLLGLGVVGMVYRRRRQA